MKKIEHIWSVICTSSSNDKQSNNMSLFNLVEEFSLQISKNEAKKIKDKKKLVIPFNQEIASRFFKSKKGVSVIFEMRLDIVTPSSKVIKGKEIKTFNFDKKFSNIRIVNRVSTIPVEGSGLYRFSMKIREVGETKFVEVGSIPVEINIDFEK